MKFMTNKLTYNKRFNYYLRMLNNAVAEDDWDYYARELDKMIGIEKKKYE